MELVLIFFVLWFCTDYLTFMYRRYLEPIGFNIEHTYQLNFLVDEPRMEEEIERTGKDRDEIIQEAGWLIYDRVKRNSDLESVAVSVGVYPYHGGNMSRPYFINGDTTRKQFAEFYGQITPDYFDVFQIPIERGRKFSLEDRGAKRIIINEDDEGNYGKYASQDIQWLGVDVSGLEELVRYDVIGVSGKAKRDPYDTYRIESYGQMGQKRMNELISDSPWTRISFRVKPEKDTGDFVERFVETMYDQLSPDPLFLSDVIPYERVKADYMSWHDYDRNFKSVFAVIFFLLMNVFLGLIGTFWFRTRQRRTEIGLRMAIGSSKGEVHTLFIGETLFLLLAASIVGALISMNINSIDVLRSIGVIVPNRNYNITDWFQVFLNFSITFVVIAIVSCLAVWYPARKASQIQPAIALRDE